MISVLDLSKYPYRIELHAHTSPVSPCSEMSPEALVRIYKEAGVDALVISNHFFHGLFPEGMNDEQTAQYYLSGYREAKREGDRIGLSVLLAAEIRFAENHNDYLVYGITEEEILEIYRLLPLGLDGFYKAFSGRDRVIVQAHPFRNGMERADTAFLDGIEVFNMHPGHNGRVALAAVHAQKCEKLVLGGSDYHSSADFADGGRAGMCLLRAPYLPKDSLALAALIRSRDYLFELGGTVIFPYLD